LGKKIKRAEVRSRLARAVLRVGTFIAVALAVAAAIIVPGELTASNVSGRSGAFLAVLLAFYTAVVLVVWAIDDKTAKVVGKVQAPDDEQAIGKGLDDAAARSEGSEHTAELFDEMKAQLSANNEQIERLSKENQRLTDEVSRLRAENTRLSGQAGQQLTQGIRASRVERTTVDPPDG
jgi:TolA-binding protein